MKVLLRKEQEIRPSAYMGQAANYVDRQTAKMYRNLESILIFSTYSVCFDWGPLTNL